MLCGGDWLHCWNQLACEPHCCMCCVSPMGVHFFCGRISHWTHGNINKWQYNLCWKWRIHVHIYSWVSGLGFLRSAILWELLLMWFHQTPKMSQAELLAYIFRQWEGAMREKMGQRKKKARETEIDCCTYWMWMCVYILVALSVPSKHLRLGLLTYCQFSL